MRQWLRGGWQEQRALPVAALTVLGVLSALVYGVVMVHPYSLLKLHGRPLVDLYGLAQGDPLARPSLIAAFVALAVLYGLSWRVARAARGRAAWGVVAGGLLLSGAVLLCLYPYDAADIFDYILHGRVLALYGTNPFQQVGASFPQDPFRSYVAWPDTPSAYGPLWELLGGGAAYLAGDGVVANVVAFKLLGGTFLAASAAVVAAILRRVAPDRALAGTLLLAWNPLVLYETLGHGHNDIAMAFWILAAVWALRSRRYTLAILALTAGALTKFVPVLLIPAAGLIALRDLPDRRTRIHFLLLAGASAALLAALAYAPFWVGAETLGIGRRQGLYSASLPTLVLVLLKAPLGDGMAAWAVSMAAASLTALFALWQAVRAGRDRAWWSFPQAAFNTLMFYLLVTCPWFQQWYAVWPLCLAALLPAGRGAVLGILFGFAVLAKPLVFEPMWVWLRPFPAEVWREVRLGPAVMALPWLMALCRMFWLKLPLRRSG